MPFASQSVRLHIGGTGTLIEVLSSTDLLLQPNKAAALYRLRHRVFAEQLQWCARSKAGEERDEYDSPEFSPLYLASFTDDGHLSGCLRLLPTSGPNMLADTFYGYLRDIRVPEDDSIWEISRFAVDYEINGHSADGRTGAAAAELIQGLSEFGLVKGINRYVALYATSMTKFVVRLGARPQFVGPARFVGDTLSAVVSFEVTERALNRIKKTTGQYDSVLGVGVDQIHHDDEETRVSCLSAI